ncbi:MAG: DUF3791 domain-containing protein [Desulfobulbaceae bacterium]|jgi:hypothetical protein|nr:DUF3791 domain-containing protein [Desulfobulbaceae bacterium]
MKKQADMTPEQSFFAVFCIETLADELHTRGDKIYTILTDDSDILDAYIIPNYDALHTQGRKWIVDNIIGMMKKEGLL